GGRRPPDRTESLGPPTRAHRRHPASVRSADDTELFARRDAACDQVLARRVHVVERVLLVLEPALLPARRAVFATAAQMTQYEHAAGFDPRRPDAAEPARQHRDVEAAVAVQNDRMRLRQVELAAGGGVV